MGASGGWSDAHVISSSCHTHLWGLWSGLTAVVQVSVQQCYVPKEWGLNWDQVIPSMDFPFSSLMAGQYFIFHDDNARIHWFQLVVGAWDTIFTHGLAITESRLESWVFLMCWWRLWAANNSPIINTRSRWKINATLDGNKCCDTSKACHGKCVL